MTRRKVRALLMSLAAAGVGAWLVASVPAQDPARDKAPAKAAAKTQAATQDQPQPQPAGPAEAKSQDVSQDKPQPQPGGPGQEKPKSVQEQMQAAKGAAQPAKQVDPSLIPPSITNFETEDRGSVYPSPVYLRRFAHADTAARLPRVQVPVATVKMDSPLLMLHEQLMRSQQEAAARAAAQDETGYNAPGTAGLGARNETDYNAPKTAPTTGTAASKPAPAKAKAKPAEK